jgi:hypothetical protein
MASAESAIHPRGDAGEEKRGVESRFQRLLIPQIKSWGVAPGWDERACGANDTPGSYEGAPVALTGAWPRERIAARSVLRDLRRKEPEQSAATQVGIDFDERDAGFRQLNSRARELTDRPAKVGFVPY